MKHFKQTAQFLQSIQHRLIGTNSRNLNQMDLDTRLLCVFPHELLGAFYYCENTAVHLVEIDKHCLLAHWVPRVGNLFSPAPSPRFCQPFLHLPLPRPQISEPPLVFPILFFPTSSWVLTGLPWKHLPVPFGYHYPSAPKFIECFFCTRPQAKHFLHTITFNPPIQWGMWFLSPFYRWKNRSILLCPDCCAILCCTLATPWIFSFLGHCFLCFMCPPLLPTIQILLISPGEPWLPQVEVISP